jgi:hypothetical protein
LYPSLLKEQEADCLSGFIVRDDQMYAMLARELLDSLGAASRLAD